MIRASEPGRLDCHWTEPEPLTGRIPCRGQLIDSKSEPTVTLRLQRPGPARAWVWARVAASGPGWLGLCWTERPVSAPARSVCKYRE